MNAPQSRTRVEEHLDARRLDLGLKWRDVIAHARISPETLRKIRLQGTRGVDPVNVRAVENALRVESGSIRAAQEGGQLAPIPDPPAELRLVTTPDGSKAWQLTRVVLGQEVVISISETSGMTEEWARVELGRVVDRVELMMRREES